MEMEKRLRHNVLYKLAKTFKTKEIRWLGIEDIQLFSQALTNNSLWRLFKDKGLWNNNMYKNHMKPSSSKEWIRKESKSHQNFSIVWKCQLKIFVSRSWMAWRIVNGKKGIVGFDSWVVVKGKFKLSQAPQEHLPYLNIQILSDALTLVQVSLLRVSCKSTQDIGLVGAMAQ